MAAAVTKPDGGRSGRAGCRLAHQTASLVTRKPGRCRVCAASSVKQWVLLSWRVVPV